MFALLRALFGFSPESHADCVRRGVKLFNAGRYQEAIAVFSKAIRRGPLEVDAYRWRSQAYMMVGDEANADADYEKIQELAPFTPPPGPVPSDEPLDDKTNTDCDSPPKPSGVSEYSKLVSEVPSDKPVGLAFARAVMYRTTPYESEGDCQQAIRDINEAPQWLRSGYPAALHNRGLAYFQLGEYERSVEDFSEAISLWEAQAVSPAADSQSSSPSDGQAGGRLPDPASVLLSLRMRGQAYLRSAKWPQAIADFTRMIEAAPDDAWWAHVCRSMCLNNVGEYDRAIADSTLAIKQNPDFFVAYLNRGYAHQQKKEFAMAIADFSEVIRLDPKHADWYKARAEVYLAAGDLAHALADQVRVQELL
jgi:tetratricopeptide (TPR) repeat protein